MRFESEEIGDVAVLKWSGSLDAASVPEFKKKVYEIVEKGASKFVLDASQIDFVDSIGLGVIISLLRRLRQKKGDFKVSCLQGDVKMVFDITRLYKLFEVYEDVDDAVRSFRQRRKKK